MRRIGWVVVLCAALWGRSAWAAFGHAYIPASAFAVCQGLGSFYSMGTTCVSLANGATAVRFADDVGEAFSTVELWFPVSASTTTINVFPWGQTNATTGTQACFTTQWEITPSALVWGSTAEWNTNNAGDASPLGIGTLILSTSSASATNSTAAPMQGVAYNQGNLPNACTVSDCVNKPGRLRVTRNIGCVGFTSPPTDTGQPFDLIGIDVDWLTP